MKKNDIKWLNLLRYVNSEDVRTVSYKNGLQMLELAYGRHIVCRIPASLTLCSRGPANKSGDIEMENREEERKKINVLNPNT